MSEEKVFIDFDPNDFIIRITPFLDKKGSWTGELMVGTVTTGENTITDDDYVNLMRMCHMVCASIPAMEARKTAEAAVREELRSLGISTVSSLPSPWNGLWRI